MRIVIGLVLSAAALVAAWFVVQPKNVDAPDFALSRIARSAPEGCDVVIEPSLFGSNAGMISAAVGEAETGARICVASGDYEDAIRVDRSVEIIGFGRTVPVITSTTGADVVQWHADGGGLENLLLLQTGGVPSGSAVTGQNGSAVFIIGQPDYFDDDSHSGLTIVNSRLSLTNVGIKNDVFSGVYVSGPDAQVRMSNAVISENAEAGILMIGGAQVALKDTRVADNRNEGIRLDTGAKLTAEGLRASGNGASAVYSQNDAGFDVSASMLRSSRAAGFVIGNRAGGSAISSTEITGHRGMAGVAMRGGTELMLDDVTISDGTTGVLCLPTLSGPDSPALRIEMRNSTVSNNSNWGVSVSNTCDVQIDAGTVTNNAGGGIENNGVLRVQASTVSRNGSHDLVGGIVSGHASALTVRDSKITSNTSHGLVLRTGAQVDVSATLIADNTDTGVLVPVLGRSEAGNYQQRMAALIARHGLLDTPPRMVFEDVDLGAHSNAAWRYDEGYLQSGDYERAVIEGLD